MCKHNLFFVLFPVFFILLSFPAWGQTAAEIEELLSQKEITYARAAYYVLAMALENPPANSDEAFAYAMERGWFSKKAKGFSPGGSVTMGNLSLLFMKAFNLKGGLMYGITKSPRYAFREMTDKGFITGRAYPGFTVSGEQFLQIAGNVLTHIGGGL